MIHLHITAWVLALILFFVSLSLQKKGNEKGAKIVKMIIRVLYLVIIGTGIMLFPHRYSYLTKWYVLKVIGGLWIIATIEMILSRTSHNRRTSVFWIQFIIAFALVLYLGFAVLPLSFLHP